MKKIGIKLADGTFFPILEDGSPEKKEINLTTVKDNQTKVKVDLYRGEKSSIDEAEYLDTLEISKMKKHPNGEPNIGLAISLDEKNELSAKIVDKESGAQSQVLISLLSEIKNSKKSGDAENSDEAEGVTLASSPAQENVSGEAENAPVEETALQNNDFSLDETISDEFLGNEPPQSSDESQSSPIDENVSEEAVSDVDVPAQETVQEITAEKNESAPTETAEGNFADDLPSLDEMDFSLPEISEQDGGAPTEAASQDDDFSLDETVSNEPPNDEPQPSTIDENVSEEASSDVDVPTQETVQDSALPDVDVPAEETVQEIPAEEAERAPVETAQDNFADALPSLDEMDFSLPEISEQDGATAEAASQDDDFSLDETVSNEPPNDEPPQSNDEPQPSPIDENVSEEASSDVDVPAQETVQDSALPDLDFPDISFDESDFSGAKNEIQNESDSASDDLDFSDMDFELPDFSSDGTSSNSDSEKKSSAHNSFDSVSEHNASSADALDFSDLYDDENDYGEQSQEKNQRFPLLVCIVCAIICVLALLGILFIAPMRFNSFSENQSQDSAQELPNDFPSERISSELPPPPERPVEPIAPPAKEDEIVVITETKNVVPDFPPPQEKKSEPKEIIYKIKWGDTLWDLSAAYYKNPWLYPKIARYNNIKNPDYIIAGSTIRIPEE